MQELNVKVHPFITIVAVLRGATLLGVMGALVATPVAASIQILLREYVDLRGMRLKASEPSEPPPAAQAPPPDAAPA